MKKTILLIVAGFFLVSGKVVKDKYRVLKWDATDINDFLHSPNVAKAYFNFTKSTAGEFHLSVAGFDVDEQLIKRWPLTKHAPPIELTNLYQEGLFYLSKRDVKEYSGNGTKSLYFYPVIYNVNYVGYDIYDDPKNVPPAEKDSAAIYSPPVRTLNPSPPR